MDDTSTLEFGDDTYKPQKRLLSFLYRNKVYPIPKEDERKPFPEKSANWLSRVFFWWLSPLMNAGYTRTLQPNDLWVLPDEMKVEHLSEIFNFYLSIAMAGAKTEHIKKKCEKRNETPETSTVDPLVDLEDFALSAKDIAVVLFFTMRKKIVIGTLLAVLCLSGVALTPLLTKALINYVENRTLGIEKNVGKGVGYSFGVALLMVATGLLMNHFFYIGMKMGAEVKVVLTNAILRKSFKLDAKARHDFPSGKITSLITTDLSRIEIAAVFQPLLICLPVPIIIAIVILIVNIRVSAVIGIVIFLVFLGFISFGAAKLFSYRDVVSKITDKRVSLIKEILNNLKMIKFYCWEQPFLDNLKKVRAEEVDIILKIQTLRNIVFAIAFTLTGISAMIAFIILYAIDGSKRTPANIFSSVSSFGIMAMMIFFIPQALATTADMVLGFKRIGKFLSAGDEKKYENYREIDTTADHHAIELVDATFHWEIFEDEDDDEDKEEESGDDQKKLSRKEKKKLKKEKAERAKKRKERQLEREQREKDLKELGIKESTSNFKGLQAINLTIDKGEFVVITGSIGSGKSSLLNAIAGFMKCEAGDININGSLLLCGAPWIQNTTIRENITFGLDYDQEFYDQVIRACALHIDLNNLDGGDFTEVGEKGITLSGGQKARINLARAVYADKDIILLDDVLSAVDARVGKHILDECLLGLLKDKTRVLATHQLSLIGQAHRIIFVNGDGSIDVGQMDKLLSSNDNFAKLMEHSQKEKEEEEDEDVEFEEKVEIDSPSVTHYEIDAVSDPDRSSTKKTALASVRIDDNESEQVDYNLNKDAVKGKIIKDEERAVNSIKSSVYKNYMKYGSGKFTPWLTLPIFALLLALATFCDIFSNTWLSFWVANKFPQLSTGFYIGFYVLFNILNAVFLVAAFVFFITITTISSKNLNLMAMNRIMYTPMSFMDTTPMGRIMNRFTKDTDALDNEISENLKFCFTAIAKMIGIFVLFIIYIPWVAIALPFILVIFFLVANFYQASNREVKRLEAVLRSFVYNNVNEILSGMNTIKAYRDQERFCKTSDKFLNQANEATFVVFANQRWIGIVLDMLANSIVLLVALLCSNRVFKINAASVGLLLTYSLLVAGELTNLVRTFTQVENDMNSVERICHYALNLEQEAPYSIPSTAPPSDWPSQGEIEFEDVEMRYRAGLPLVLKKLSFKVGSGEKIGICGRTGAGKSSIMTALYRLAELDAGKIVIDGIDIATLGLRDLRSQLSIIPQDPVLFQGTIRKNLDPFSQYLDDKLWDSLTRTGLIDEAKLESVKNQSKDEEAADEVTLHKFHLDQTVEDEGTNFSLGERQLIAFARALVRESKILILDEATSSVDYQTDAKIQRTIIKEFSDCTILTIAHRLKTILNYSRILVLDKGQVIEFDTPWNLYNQENSIFRTMCQKSHITQLDFQETATF
ncbi:Oligomycin resistance ATP-dependent permease YOR1 [Candida viswanathii]|uniref:Oligomycin resistance ATP-dependent permease YOR1 n=1 Tax=Candida viswanathii TaxID=5486 RepID=A0A367Y2Q9_9ASCO|nr:Oligomycin resistance ATP-dependent permease YOR1 [Candida viswanathii]